MKIRGRRSKAATIPNNSVYRLLGSAYEKTSNGSWIKKTRMSKPPLTRVGFAWVSPAAAKIVWDSLTSFHIFPTGNSTVSLNICAQRWRIMQKQEAWLSGLVVYWRNIFVVSADFVALYCTNGASCKAAILPPYRALGSYSKRWTSSRYLYYWRRYGVPNIVINRHFCISTQQT